MKQNACTAICIIFFTACVSPRLPLPTQQAPINPLLTSPAPASPVAGSYRGGTIQEKQMEARGGITFYSLLQEQYELKTRILEDIAFEQLLLQKAQEEKLTPNALIQREIDDKIQEPSQEEYLKARREIRQARHLPADEVSAKAEVLSAIRRRDRDLLFKAFKSRLLAEGDFQVELHPPRIKVPSRHHSPSRGPEDAPITLVEFSDFQCAFCRASQEQLRRLWVLYPDLLRHIWRAMPLDDKLATTVALWAQGKGRYWHLRQAFFSVQGDLTPAVMKARMEELQMDSSVLENKKALRIQRLLLEQDLADARSIGLESAPSFFINGRYLKGMPPLPIIARIINEELRRAGIPPSPEQKAAEMPDFGQPLSDSNK